MEERTCLPSRSSSASANHRFSSSSLTPLNTTGRTAAAGTCTAVGCCCCGYPSAAGPLSLRSDGGPSAAVAPLSRRSPLPLGGNPPSACMGCMGGPAGRGWDPGSMMGWGTSVGWAGGWEGGCCGRCICSNASQDCMRHEQQGLTAARHIRHACVWHHHPHVTVCFPWLHLSFMVLHSIFHFTKHEVWRLSC